MRAAAAATALTVASAAAGGCAYIIHPEQRGNRGGDLDGVPLVVDILLILPGVIPGVIALIVDFSSGAIYAGGHHHIVSNEKPKTNVASLPTIAPGATAAVAR